MRFKAFLAVLLMFFLGCSPTDRKDFPDGGSSEEFDFEGVSNVTAAVSVNWEDKGHLETLKGIRSLIFLAELKNLKLDNVEAMDVVPLVYHEIEAAESSEVIFYCDDKSDRVYGVGIFFDVDGDGKVDGRQIKSTVLKAIENGGKAVIGDPGERDLDFISGFLDMPLLAGPSNKVVTVSFTAEY